MNTFNSTHSVNLCFLSLLDSLSSKAAKKEDSLGIRKVSCFWLCVCVRVCERETKREKEKEKERVCASVCVREKERERERERERESV